ncbi:MAG: helix-turn-helix domain-containing protein [Bacteroidetes bacterium]|nr:helix-turn-helix domain-containing protein [Bacteroidota bacterium]
MSYYPDKAIPLAVSTLEEVTKLIVKKDDKASDESLEAIFVEMFRDETLKREEIDEMFFRLHAACSSAVRFMKSENFKTVMIEKEMAKELSYEEVGEELGVSYSQVKKLVKEGKLNTIKYSQRTVRITYGEIERYRREESV